MTMNWSDEAWLAAQPIYDSILNLPFVRELGSGTLPEDKFIFYLQQDALYIENYCRVLAHIASRMPRMDHVKAFLDFAQDGVAVEQAMHGEFLKGYDSVTEKSPACLLYTSLLSAQATAPVEIEAAAVLPCFWVYLRVGKHIASLSCANNPYKAWIDTYSDPVFDESARAIDICNILAENASTRIRRQMTEIYVQCTRMEWLFWDSAYKLEKWTI